MSVSEAWVDFLAGWASGAVAVLACQPVDTLLTRVQAGNQLVVGGSASANVRLQAQGLVNNFGPSSLWRGSSAMIGAVPMQNSLLMGGYGLGKQWALANPEHPTDDTTNENSFKSLMAIFAGGCTGGVVQSFLMSPVELLKVSQQVNVTKSARVAGKELLQGWNSASWRGLNATLLRDGIPHGVWFVSYEWSKNSLSPNFEPDSIGTNVVVPIVSGAVAATVAWAVGYPFDIIKTRIQASQSGIHKGIYTTALELVKEANGQVLNGLYRGFGLKLVRAVPASMIGFLTYETVAGYIRREK